MSKSNTLRPLYRVNELAQAVGQEITYAYDDLVFISHSDVLIQFVGGDEDPLNLYLHQDLDSKVFGATKAKYEINAKQQGTTLQYKGRFSMNPKEGCEEIDLQFFPA